jgi:hypothetical protein
MESRLRNGQRSKGKLGVASTRHSQKCIPTSRMESVTEEGQPMRFNPMLGRLECSTTAPIFSTASCADESTGPGLRCNYSTPVQAKCNRL